MWNRNLNLEPAIADTATEIAQSTLIPAVHGLFEQFTTKLFPAETKCEALRLGQLPARVHADEQPVGAVIFSAEDEPRNVGVVIFSQELVDAIVGDATAWNDKVKALEAAANLLVSDVPAQFGWGKLSAPSFVFDMFATAVEASATVASENRHYSVVTRSLLRGKEPGQFALRLFLCDSEILRQTFGAGVQLQEAA